MKFYQRFAYYLVGLIMGSFFVAMVFSGKDTRCNYFPNSRVLNDLRNKPFHYSEEANKKIEQKLISIEDIKNTLQYGDVDFDKSDVKSSKGKTYIIYGKTLKNKEVTFKIINYSDKAELVDVYFK